MFDSNRYDIQNFYFGIRSFLFAICILNVSLSELNAQGISLSNEELSYDSSPNMNFISEDTIDDLRLFYRFTIRWDHAWNNKKNNDAAWIFFKVSGSDPGNSGENSSVHGKIIEGSIRAHSVADTPAAKIELASDRLGFFISPAEKHNGPVSWTVEVELESEILKHHTPYSQTGKVHAIEMVLVPQGPFYVGASSEAALNYGAFYKSGDQGQYAGLFKIDDESAVAVSPRDGDLYYQVGERSQFLGDQHGPIPSDFPKGFNAFYIMKYEISQGEYAAFLNSLSDDAIVFRANIGGRRYYTDRGSVEIVDGDYLAKSPLRPANFIGWVDALAYLDWAALRPMTDLEFTKASRGPIIPAEKDYPWGSSSKAQLMRGFNDSGDLVMHDGSTMSLLADNTREVFGASYFWVMDLAGGLWERTVTFTHPEGRAFLGSHGDGQLNSYGEATNDDWPSAQRDHGIGGFGYRGGGYYEDKKILSEYNPHSAVAYRPWGAWSGGRRRVAYGARGVRTTSTP